MLDIFSGLRLVVKRRSISIDNAIFRCHWFFTSTLLVSFSLIITARQYVGEPIECHSVSKIAESLLNSFCWVQSTFTVPQACDQQIGLDVPYPCIDNSRGRDIKVFAYYQWVGLVLFLQGLLFHLPYYLWKVWENGLIKAITGGLRVAVISDQERIRKRDIVVEYINDHLGCHRPYALKYFLCEFICLLNLLAQLWATNKFFDGQFLRYGVDVMRYSSSTLSNQFGLSSSSNSQLASQKNHSVDTNHLHGSNKLAEQSHRTAPSKNAIDPMTFIFPRITKCTFHNFGSSGDIQKHDALCLLPLNIINEKIYIALWFWFLILASLTILVILYRILAILFESVRCKGLISRCKLSSEKDIRMVCHYGDIGDWFLFYMVAENLDPLVMREIVKSVADKIRDQVVMKRKLSENYSLENESCKDELCYDEPESNNRRSSVADDIPLVSKIKKRQISKRLWSADLGPIELRRQLAMQQPPINPDHEYSDQSPIMSPVRTRTQTTNFSVSAPPINEMLLGFGPPLNLARRCGSLSRLDGGSQSNCPSSFVIEMPTITGFSSGLNGLDNSYQGGDLHRRRSAMAVHCSGNST